MEKNLELSKDKMNDLLSNLITERYKMVCDAYRLSEFLKKCANAKIEVTNYERKSTDINKN